MHKRREQKAPTFCVYTFFITLRLSSVFQNNNMPVTGKVQWKDKKSTKIFDYLGCATIILIIGMLENLSLLELKYNILIFHPELRYRLTFIESSETLGQLLQFSFD